MTQKRKRGRGRRGVGQSNRATPKDLRDSGVAVPRPDGGFDVVPAPKARRAKKKPQRRGTPEPVPIEKIDPTRGKVEPRNERDADRDAQGRLRTEGWTRNNSDALPRRRD